MNPLTVIFILICFGYIFTTLRRLIHFILDGGLYKKSGPKRILFVGFFIGLNNLVSNYEVQRRFHNFYLSFMPYQPTSIKILFVVALFVSFILFQYVFFTAVRDYTVIDVSPWMFHFIIFMFVFESLIAIIYYERVPFYRLQVIISVITALAGSVIVLYYAPAMKKISEYEKDALHRAQFWWSNIYSNLGFLAVILIVIDGIYKLWNDVSEIYSPLYIIATVCFCGSIIALGIMNEGKFSFLPDYPSKLRAYQELSTLYDEIQATVAFPDAYTMPLDENISPEQIDTTIYRLVVKISDRYVWLKEDMPLRTKIESIIQLDVPIDQIVARLVAIQV